MMMTMQGNRLKVIRKELGLTQQAFAERLGLTATFVGMMERGDAPIDVRTERAARELDIDNAPWVAGILIGGVRDGELVWINSRLHTTRVTHPKQMASFVAPGTAAPPTPTYAYHRMDLGDGVTELVFVAEGDGRSADEVRAAIEAMRAAGKLG